MAPAAVSIFARPTRSTLVGELVRVDLDGIITVVDRDPQLWAILHESNYPIWLLGRALVEYADRHPQHPPVELS